MQTVNNELGGDWNDWKIIDVGRYKKTSDEYCGKEIGKSYSTMSDAATSCNIDRFCGGFYDYSGSGDTFKTCRGPVEILMSRKAVLYRKCK